MRAVVQSGYGDPQRVLSVGDVPRPRPAADEVLVEVTAASVHPDVWHVVTGRPLALRAMGSGWRRPQPVVPGTDMAGTVVEVGTDVRDLEVGDRVFGETLRGMQWRNGGTWAEYVATPVTALARLPDDVDPAAAATVPTAGLIVLQNLGPLAPFGSHSAVLVNGAGGGVGSIAVQLLAARGARVTAVDHGDKLDLLRELGATEVIDFTTTDASAAGGPYDLVLDIPGNHPYTAWRPRLAPQGRYVLIGHDGYGRHGRRMLGSIPTMLGLMVRSMGSPHLSSDLGRFDRTEAIGLLADRLAAGDLTPVVEHELTLEDAPTALRLLADGAHGRIVLRP